VCSATSYCYYYYYYYRLLLLLCLRVLNPWQTWCVLGNFFSLKREHEAALKLFERALQLDPTFT